VNRSPHTEHTTSTDASTSPATSLLGVNPRARWRRASAVHLQELHPPDPTSSGQPRSPPTGSTLAR
jgi:hypothetical protein